MMPDTPYECRSCECSKVFKYSSNKNRYEEVANHAPPSKEQAVKYIKVGDAFKCLTCEFTSHSKYSAIRNIKNGRKLHKKEEKNRERPHCKEIFLQKSNHDRHVKRFHAHFPEKDPVEDDDNLIRTSFKCRGGCNKVFTHSSNRNRHEKRANHAPPAKEPSVKPIKIGNAFKCLTCEFTSHLKFSVVRHIKKGCTFLRRKKYNTKECPYCKGIFARKSNRDRHVRNIHAAFPEIDIDSVDDDNVIRPSFVSELLPDMNIQKDFGVDQSITVEVIDV